MSKIDVNGVAVTVVKVGSYDALQRWGVFLSQLAS